MRRVWAGRVWVIMAACCCVAGGVACKRVAEYRATDRQLEKAVAVHVMSRAKKLSYNSRSRLVCGHHAFDVIKPHINDVFK